MRNGEIDEQENAAKRQKTEHSQPSSTTDATNDASKSQTSVNDKQSNTKDKTESNDQSIQANNSSNGRRSSTRQVYPPYSEEDSKYLHAFNYLNNPVWVYDITRHRQFFANKVALENVWNCTLAQFLAKDHTDNSESTDKFLGSLQEKWNAEINAGKPCSAEHKQWTVYPHGKPTCLAISMSGHKCLLNGTIMMLVTGELSPVNRAAETKRGLEALRHTTALVRIYDMSGRILLQNESAQTTIAFPSDMFEDEALPSGSKIDCKKFLPYVKDRDEVQSIVDSVSSGETYQKQLDVTINGQDKIHLLRALRITDPVTGNNSILVHEEDVTATVQQQKDNIAYKLANKLKDEFLANTSHELKNPLHAIIGLAETLLDGADPDDCTQTLALIIESAKRLTDLVNELLELAKLSRTDLEVVKKERVNMLNTIDQIAAMTKPLATKKGLQFTVHLPSDLPFVAGDESRLKQVLHNIIGNAIKFTDQGSVEILARAQGKFVTVTVTDTGIGINPNDLKSVLEPFSQSLDITLKRKYGGTGLGLSIAKKLLELHGGSIQLTSTLGKGTSVTFSVPTATFDTPTGQVASVGPVSKKRKSVEKELPRILSVDDDPINQMLLKNLLSKNGFQVIQAMNGMEALKALSEMGEMPDLILLDVMMPGMSGIEVCRTIRSSHSESVPVIMVSAKTQSENIQEGLQAGATDYVCKPFQRVDLLSRIRSHVVLKGQTA